MPIDYSKVSVLVVEDNEFIRRIIVKMLRASRMQDVLEAPDGKTAIRMLLDGVIPDVLICDIKMSPVDGLELVEFVRSDLELKKRQIPVIMLTANPVKEDVLKARSYGVEAFLAKPVSKESLFQRLEFVLTQKPAPEEA
jgi:two-component system chemotaxis response regulator CheY